MRVVAIRRKVEMDEKPWGSRMERSEKIKEEKQ